MEEHWKKWESEGGRTMEGSAVKVCYLDASAPDGFFSFAPPGLVLIFSSHPGLAPWARLLRPFGAEGGKLFMKTV